MFFFAIAQPQPAFGQLPTVILRGTIVDAEAPPTNVPLVLKAPMTQFNGVAAMDYGGAELLPVDSILSVPAIHSVTFLPNPNGVHIKVNLTVGLRVSGNRDVFTTLESDALHAYDQGTAGPPAAVTYAIGPAGFRNVRGYASIFSEGFLQALYEVHNDTLLPDDPIFRVAPSGPTPLVGPGDPVPNDPPGAGGTFIDVHRPTPGANHDAWTGDVTTGGSGAFTRRRSDGARFRMVDAGGQNFGLGASGTMAFHGDELIISTGGTSASGGIYRVHPEGQTPAGLILPHRTNYDPENPDRQFRDGTVSDIDGGMAVIVGRAEGSVPALFIWNIETGQMLEIARNGMPMPGGATPGGGGGTFVGFQNAAISARGPQLSDSLVAFVGRESATFAPVGLFVWTQGNILTGTRAGNIVDGKEVQSVGFEATALNGNVLGSALVYSEGGSAARIACIVDFRVTRIVQTSGGTVVEGVGAANSTHKVLVTDDLNQPYQFLKNVGADSDGTWGFVDDYFGAKRFYKAVLAGEILLE